MHLAAKGQRRILGIGFFTCLAASKGRRKGPQGRLCIEALHLLTSLATGAHFTLMREVEHLSMFCEMMAEKGL